MSTPLVWAALLLGVATVAVRREGVASLLVAVQTVLVAAGVAALVPGDPDLLVPAGVLAAKALAVALLLAAAARRAPVPPPRETTPPAARVVVTLVLVLASIPLVPPLGLEPAVAEDGAVALVAAGLALLVTRRPAIFAVLALLVAENGIAMAAASVPGGLPLAIEVGVAVDVVLVLTVAIVFHGRLLAALRGEPASREAA